MDEDELADPVVRDVRADMLVVGNKIRKGFLADPTGFGRFPKILIGFGRFW